MTAQSAQSSPALRILLIDRHETLRRALARRLLEHPRVASVVDMAEVDDDVLKRDQPDVVLIDPGTQDGWQAPLRKLIGARGTVAGFLVVAHVVRYEAPHAAEALAIGVDVYLPKGQRTETLVEELLAASEARERLPH